MVDMELLRDYLRKVYLFADRQAALDDDACLYPGLIDSLEVMELVAFIEDKYHVEVQDEWLVAENFRTLRAVARLIEVASA